ADGEHGPQRGGHAGRPLDGGHPQPAAERPRRAHPGADRRRGDDHHRRRGGVRRRPAGPAGRTSAGVRESSNMTGRRWRLHAIGVTLCAAAYGYGLFRLLGKVPLSEAAGDALSVPLWVMDRVVWPLTFGVGLTWAVALG